MTETPPATNPSEPGDDATGDALRPGGVVAVIAENTIDAVELAQRASPEASLLRPESGTWSAEEIGRIAGLAIRTDTRELIVCGLEWLRPDLTPRLLKPLEEHGRPGAWLLPVSDISRLPAPLAGRVTGTLAAPGSGLPGGRDGRRRQSLIEALWRRRETLKPAEQQALSRLIEALEGALGAERPALRAHRVSEAVALIAPSRLGAMAGGRGALCDAILSDIEQRLICHLASQPGSAGEIGVAAEHLASARSGLAWNTPVWPLMTLALAAAAQSTSGHQRPEVPVAEPHAR